MSPELTKRQKSILKAIVYEYIESAEPISSRFLQENYDFGIQGAMLRREMQRLTESGYFKQPHTSAGRIPTDKAYRFVVNDILLEFKKKTRKVDNKSWAKFSLKLKEEDIYQIMYYLVEELAEQTSCFAIGYLLSRKVLLKEGWENVLQQPEFESLEYVYNFARFIKELQECIEELRPNFSSIDILIGKEHSMIADISGNVLDFSTIVTSYPFSSKEIGLLALVGPMRMPYKRHINLLGSLPSLVEKIIMS